MEETCLGDLRYIANHFRIDVGLSDHTISNTAAILAIALGAPAIEKHFKLDGKDSGPDSTFSILPDQLKDLCKQCHLASEAVRSNKLRRTVGEEINKKFRRSLYFVSDLSKGQVISAKDIKRIRPDLAWSQNTMMMLLERNYPVTLNGAIPYLLEFSK